MSHPYSFQPTEQGYDDTQDEVTEVVHGLIDVIPFADDDDPDVFDATVQQVVYWHPDIDFDNDYYPCSSFITSAVENY